jgi:hypothetical protein
MGGRAASVGESLYFSASRFDAGETAEPLAAEVMPTRVPDQWRAYDCADYFEEGWWERGHFDEPSQTLVIVPLDETYEEQAADFFAIGRSGADGIDFGYRKGHAGLWAFYPIDRQFKFMAPSVETLVKNWCDGNLSV